MDTFQTSERAQVLPSDSLASDFRGQRVVARMHTERSLGLRHQAGCGVHGTAGSVMFVARLTYVLAVK